MKRHGIIIPLVLLALIISFLGYVDNAQAQKKPPEQKIIVLNPLGTPPPIILRPMAPRLNTLEGRTIYIVDDGYLGGDNLLFEMIDWFSKEMPKTRVVFRRKGGFGFDAEDPALWAEMKEQADAIIIGMGH